MLITEPGSILKGVVGGTDGVSLPGDKSISHRAALFSALADGESMILNFQVSGVTRVMLDALTKLGIEWELEGNRLIVRGGNFDNMRESQLKFGEPVYINCGNSATTMRLLAGAIPVIGIESILDGSGGLRNRPMGRIMDPLRMMGVEIEASGGFAPLHIKPIRGRLHAIDYTLPVASAQVKSCLILAGLAAEGKLILREPGTSRDHSERMLSAMGAHITSYQIDSQNDRKSSNNKTWFITELTPKDSMRLEPLKIKIPGDISAAAFIIVAALIIPGSKVLLKDVGINPTRTGLVEALEMMGAQIEINNIREWGGEPVGDILIQSSSLNGINISGSIVVRMIDEFPIFAVAAAYARGRTYVSDARELRYKETDRISTLVTELKSLGCQIEEKQDGFVIEGGKPLKGINVNGHGDHRLAMALIVAGLACNQPVTIEDYVVLDESFPEFITVIQFLGAKLRIDIH